MLKQILAFTLCSLGVVSPIEVLTDENFHSKVLDSSDPWILHFHIPGCDGKCTQVKAELTDLAALLEEANAGVKIGLFRTDTNSIPDNYYNVMADIPRVSLIWGAPGQKNMRTLYSSGDKRDFDHQIIGEKVMFGLDMARSAAEHAQAQKEVETYDNLIDGNNKGIAAYDHDQFENMLSKQGIHLVVSYRTGCPWCRELGWPLVWLAEQVQGKVTIAKVNADVEQGHVRRFGALSVPTFLIFGNTVEEKQKPILWVNGGLSHLVATMLRDYLKVQYDRAQEGLKIQAPYPREYSKVGQVHHLTSLNNVFQEHVIDSEDFWVVAFVHNLYEDGAQFAQDYHTMANELYDLAKFGTLSQYEDELEQSLDLAGTTYGGGVRDSQIFIFNSQKGEAKQNVLLPRSKDHAKDLAALRDYLTDARTRAAKGDHTMRPTQVDRMPHGECACCAKVENFDNFEEEVMGLDEVLVMIFHGKYDIEKSGKFVTEFHQGSGQLEGKAKCFKFQEQGEYLEKRFKIDTDNYPQVRILKRGVENKVTKLAMKYNVIGDGNDMARINKIVQGL